MAEFDAAHVERRRIDRHVTRVFDEDELGIGVDPAADQPGTRRPIDMTTGAGRPPHLTGSAVAANTSTA
jgi:hypothetical protein